MNGSVPKVGLHLVAMVVRGSGACSSAQLLLLALVFRVLHVCCSRCKGHAMPAQAAACVTFWHRVRLPMHFAMLTYSLIGVLLHLLMRITHLFLSTGKTL